MCLSSACCLVQLKAMRGWRPFPFLCSNSIHHNSPSLSLSHSLPPPFRLSLSPPFFFSKHSDQPAASFPGCGLGRMHRGDDHGDSAVESREMQARFCEECRDDKPHFFKIMTNGSAKPLRIPPAFLEHINVSSHHAILKGPSNNIWRVEVKQIRHGTIFRKGWKRFHRDHCLEFGDFLVFGYDGNMHFSVHIFDRSACEKESAFHVKNSKGNHPPTECQVGVESGNNMRATSRASEHKKGKSKEQVERPLRRGVISQRRAITDEEIGRVLAAASSFRSDRPYCRIVMAPSHVYFGFFMRVPCKFRDYLPSTASDLTLWDPNGKPWPVRYVCLRRYGALSGGWGKFTLHHNLEEGDICIFELIKEKELKVHIFRVVEPLFC